MKKLLMLLTLAAFALCGCSKYDYSSDHAFKESFVAQAKKEGLSEIKPPLFTKIYGKNMKVSTSMVELFTAYIPKKKD